MPEINTHAGNLRLIGGRLCLDFVNTANEHTLAQPKEHLRDYAALIAWGRHAGALAGEPGERLLAEAARRPAAAQAVLAEARRLRMALYIMFSALPQARPVPPDALAALNDALARAPRRTGLDQAGARLVWVWKDEVDALDQVLWPVAWSAADLLTAPELGRVRECGGEGCSWLFLDTSRSGTRRWCSMEDCGNRAKARRHYATRRSTQL
jgi:predicted RNA-binding Zn ribbon-like protein